MKLNGSSERLSSIVPLQVEDILDCEVERDESGEENEDIVEHSQAEQLSEDRMG